MEVWNGEQENRGKGKRREKWEKGREIRVDGKTGGREWNRGKGEVER